MNRMTRLLLVATLLLTGCGRKNPVDEISVSQSGIKITPQSPESLGRDWPGWRGPTGDGVAPDQPLATAWSESSGVLWRADVPGRGHSSPVVVADSVYLATATTDQQQLLAFDRATGDVRWTTTLHQGGLNSRVHNKATHANGTVACDGQRLFIAFLNDDAIIASAVDLNGDPLWQKEIGKFVSKFGYAPSPVLYGSLVIFAADNMGGGYLTALDTASGQIAWRVARTNDSSYSSPAIAKVGGRDQLLISGGNAVTSYDPATGDQLWRTKCTTEATCGTVVTNGDLIFASGGHPDEETVCLTAEGKIVWTDRVKVYEPSLVVAGDSVVAVSDAGIAYAWEAKSGDLQWKKRLGGNFSSSPIVCNGLVYVSNLNGKTFVFACADGKFQSIAENQLGSDCYASPAAVNGQLFMRIGNGQGASRQEELVCLAAATTE